MNQQDNDYWISFSEAFWENVGTWLNDHLIPIVLIIIGAWLAKHYGTHLVSRILRRTVRADLYPTKADRVKRIQTLDSITKAIISVGVIVVAVIMVLSELGINTAPLIASAGVLGIALGFGAQSLVKDFSSGLFIIADNQYRVGDVVKVNNVAGVVEAIALRTTVIRAFDGTQYHVPNGSIGVTANMTMGYGGFDENIVFSQDADIAKVTLVINRVGQEMADDPSIAKDIKEAPQVMWVVGFDANGITVKVVGKTTPGESWRLRGEFYRRLIIALRKSKLEIPYTQVVVHPSGEIHQPTITAQADSDSATPSAQRAKQRTVGKTTRKGKA